ncbi:dTDP-4-dehydrorhamnose reductase [Loktanella fryxellensis]|uniref:dTDP-4-dehydrorhamnose reductase n=1 Tax=Loktanella fryxellensis TaxID=245187 RepID=A0A1H8H2W3_9RHOB|nr:dTDP-4-dehydrorhamnose reductase [Loktanella fryxellensis]SEN50314.1 dTDP-4-dehydrorhamnose reductase [Loktanella fryxellensis]
MKVLVFGQTGQVARALASAGPARGIAVQTLDRTRADLSDPAACAAAVTATDADAVINAAAWTAVDAAEAQEDAAHVVNADSPGAIARACAARGLPVVHISTDYVFDGGAGPAWTPDAPTGPMGAYGRTKLAGERAVLDSGAVAVVLRTAWVFDGGGKSFMTTMLRLSETRDTVGVVADQIGGPTPAAAIADACLTIAARLADGSGRPDLGQTGVHHFSGAPDVSWADFARAIMVTAGRSTTIVDITTADYPTPARRPANSRLDCSSLTAAYGIVRPDWQAALTRIIQETRT